MRREAAPEGGPPSRRTRASARTPAKPQRGAAGGKRTLTDVADSLPKPPTRRSREQWTAEQEQQLAGYVQQHADADTGRIDWTGVEDAVPGRTLAGCEKHQRERRSKAKPPNDDGWGSTIATPPDGWLATTPGKWIDSPAPLSSQTSSSRVSPASSINPMREGWLDDTPLQPAPQPRPFEELKDSLGEPPAQRDVFGVVAARVSSSHLA